MAPWLRPAAAVLAVGLLAGCSGGSSSGGTTQQPSAAAASSRSAAAAPAPALSPYYRQKLVWHDCKDHLQCTRVTVPLDYAHPAAGSLRLSVNRLRASGSRVGSLVFNPGGPGVSGLGYIRQVSSVVTDAVRARYDIVGFDPRGVGASRGLQCLTDTQLDTFIGYDGSPDSPAEEQGLVRQGEILGAGCEKADPALLRHMSTVEAARDLDVLRAVLGDKQLTYLGKSYGTFLGATYAGLFPKRVGRLVLDGALDPASSELEVATQQAYGFERALGAFLDDCLRRSSCPLHGSRAAAEARLVALVDSTDQHPLPGGDGRRLSQSLALSGIAVALYDKGSWSFLRRGLEEALQGDGQTLMLLADFYADRGPGGHYTSNTNEAIYAVNCLDRPQPGGVDSFRAEADRIAARAPLFGRYIVWSYLPCTTWPVPPTGRAGPITAAGSRPILVVGTTRDPATPYSWAQALAKELAKGHLLTHIGDGHTAYRMGSRCIDRAVDAYFLDGKLPAAGTRCR